LLSAIPAKLRKLRLLPWLAWTFVVGLVVRRFRRLAGSSPRIWHGMFPLHVTRGMVEADRIAGFTSRSVIGHFQKIRIGLVTDRDFDVVILERGVAQDEAHWYCLFDLLWHGDIWSAYFDCLFFPADRVRANTWVFRLVRWAGIRIVVAPHGGDIVYRSAFVNRYDVIGRKQADYPAWDLVAFEAIARTRLELFCRHASLVLGADNGLRRFLPRNDILFKYFPIDCAALRPLDAAQHNDVPVITHAPNHRLTKGTDYLQAAIIRLQQAGIACRLELLEGLPRTEALRRYQSADIIADQFCDGAFGLFAAEGLALGKPVLTYLDQEHLGDPVFNLPLVNTNPENLLPVLAVLLQVTALRERLGHAGRESVSMYQSIPAMAEVWNRIYRHMWWGESLNLETTKHFSPDRKPRSYTEDPSRADFWPVPVDDLLPEIHRALARVDGNRVAVTACLEVTGKPLQ